MIWVGVLAGLIIGLTFGMVITCFIIIDKKLEELEK